MIPHLLLTGSSRGIGAAAFDALQPRTRLIGHATRAGEHTLAGDLSRSGAAETLWAEALERLDGHIDVLVNNAGVFEASTLGDPDWLTKWQRTLTINLTAAAELCRLAVLHWQTTSRPGRIVNVASRAAHRGDSPAHWHYAASKAGLVAVTKTIARAYAADGILAFAVCPGFVLTGMAEDYLESRGGDALLSDIPLGRVATPDEVAGIVTWLALDAPASMTGAVVDANGASYVR